MTARIDLTGRRFGRWAVIGYAGNRRWSSVCDCGTTQDVEGGSLRRGLSSGCTKCADHNGALKHGGKRSRLYNIWSGMKRRCENEVDAAFKDYGGRGIAVCDEWSTRYEAFRDWALASGYSAALTIDRRDNSKGYDPKNCRWATYAEQNRNSRRNRPVMFRGRQVLICDLASEVGLPQDILKNRVFRYGWDIEQAVATPVLPKGARRPFRVIKANIDSPEATI